MDMYHLDITVYEYGNLSVPQCTYLKYFGIHNFGVSKIILFFVRRN